MLIVSSRVDGRFYAIEDAMAPRGTYALCRLANWVTREDVEMLGGGGKGREEDERRACRNTKDWMGREGMAKLGVDRSNWWHAAVIPGPRRVDERLFKRRRLDGPRPMLKIGTGMSCAQKVKAEGMDRLLDATTTTSNPSLSLSTSQQKEVEIEADMFKAPTPSHPTISTTITTTTIVEDPKTTPSADELTGNLIHHYLDSLYLSRISLAYFAKGPLSRLRGAAVAGGVDCEKGGGRRVLSLLELADFLRAAMLTPSLLEKKYKETLPAVIRGVYGSDDDDDNNDHDGSGLSTLMKAAKPDEKQRKRKERKKRPLKPGKNGLFPNEEDVVKKWWLTCDRGLAGGGEFSSSTTVSPFKTKVEAMTARLGALRLREIFAQIIIALEVLAVEGSSAFADEQKAEDAVAAAADATTAGQGDIAHEKKKAKKGEEDKVENDVKSKQRGRQKAKKKKQDVQLVLDLLVDKLCIWRSIEQQELSFKESSSRDGNATRDGKARKDLESTDVLADFCVEVIIPL